MSTAKVNALSRSSSTALIFVIVGNESGDSISALSLVIKFDGNASIGTVVMPSGQLVNLNSFLTGSTLGNNRPSALTS